MQPKINQQQQGSAPIYMVLLVILILTSSAFIISGVLSQQLRATQDIIDNTRALYAGMSGAEHSFAELIQNFKEGQFNETVEVAGEIPYGSEAATYTSEASLIVSEDGTQAFPCIASKGAFRQETRRVQFGGADFGCEQE